MLLLDVTDSAVIICMRAPVCVGVYEDGKNMKLIRWWIPRRWLENKPTGELFIKYINVMYGGKDEWAKSHLKYAIK